jgi:hypothetical protein
LKTEQLVADVIAGGGTLTLPDETTRGGVNYRQRAYAAQRHGKVPEGKHLTVAWTREGFVISLEEGATGNELGADAVPVPTRLTKYHRVAAAYRARTDLHEVSRKALTRAVRIVHALALAVEKRGYELDCIPAQREGYGRDAWKPKQDGQLVITINGHSNRIRLREKGVGLRAVWEREKEY